MKFQKQNRLLSTAEFQRVYTQRVSVADPVLIVYAAPNTLGRMRLGLSVSRKVGNAVVRNRWKRLIREVFRLHLLGQESSDTNSALDLIVLPKQGIEPVPFEVLRQSLEKNVRRVMKRILKNASVN